MDVVFEGRLTDDVQLKNVLQKVLEKRPSGNLLLRVATSTRDCDGKICIVDGRFITAAIISNTRESGYPAVRKLLSIKDGNFACLRPSSDDSLSIPYSLNIELEKILPLVPNLPESPNGLHDEKSLLDKVFGANAFDALEERAATKPQVVDIKPQNPNASWQLLQPLVAPGDGIAPAGSFAPVAGIAPVGSIAPAGGIELEPSVVPSTRVIEPISAEELASLTLPRTNQDSDTKIRPGKRNTGGLSPMLIIGAVGVLFVLECMAIIFWKPLSVYLEEHQVMGARPAPVSTRATTAHQPTIKRSTSQKPK